MTTRTRSDEHKGKKTKRRRAPKSFTKGRVRWRFTVPIELKELIEQLAEQADMSVPQLTGMLIERGLQLHQEEALKKHSQKTVSGDRADWYEKQGEKDQFVTRQQTAKKKTKN